MQTLVEFADRLKEAGFLLEGLPVMDGKWHRAKVEEDKKGKSHREGAAPIKVSLTVIPPASL
jgi:putative DNA primase/helicase